MSSSPVILLILGLLLIFATIPIIIYAKKKQDKDAKAKKEDSLNHIDT